MFKFDTTKPLYIIGDVHGCYKTLCALVEKLPNKWDSQLVFVGDLVDRGENSAEVVEAVKNGGYACVLGNHEQLMMEYYGAIPSPMSSSSVWISNGGSETMQSYKDNGGHQKIYEHLDWLLELPRFLEIDYCDENGLKLFVTHGFGLPLYRTREKDEYKFMWNRLRKYDIYKEAAKYYGVFNVFGHDVQDDVLIMDNFAAIDTGCVYINKKENPSLSALEWPSKAVFKVPYCG